MDERVNRLLELPETLEFSSDFSNVHDETTGPHGSLKEKSDGVQKNAIPKT